MAQLRKIARNACALFGIISVQLRYEITVLLERSAGVLQAISS